MNYADLFPNKRPVSRVAQSILRKRYFTDEESKWDQVADRVIDWVTPNLEKDKQETLRAMLLNRYFIPNSPCLVNSGKENAGLAACFVVDFPDDINGIIKTKGDFMRIAKKGGGCGTSLSHLRPEGAYVTGSTHGHAGGPIKFADTISHDADAMTQSGFRSMAIMFTMSVYHPDIIKFINAKAEEGRIANANLSVVVDDAFMNAVMNDEKYWTKFKNTDKKSRHYGEWENYDEYSARAIFDMIVEGMWRNGEPGLLFKDRIDDSPYKYTGAEIFATNPCGEQPLPAGGMCNLGSIDLSKFVERKQFDWEKFEIAIRHGVRFLDAVIDKTGYPTKEIETFSVENRPIGLGFMGYADMLLMMGIPYGSEEAQNMLADILEFMRETSYTESEIMGDELGVPKQCKKLPTPRRNITVLTVAPTGTVSLIAGCSSGVEPVFSEVTIRNDKTGTYSFTNDLAEKEYFRCAVSSNGNNEIEVTWQEHIETLATGQRYIDAGISKTVNFPKGTRRETMYKASIMAWELGCKGLAVYRNGSRQVEVLSPKNVSKNKCPICAKDMIKVNEKDRCPSCNIDNAIENTTGLYD